MHVSNKVFCCFYHASLYDRKLKARKENRQKEERKEKEQSKLGKWFDLEQFGYKTKRTQNVKLFRFVKKEYYRKEKEEILKRRERVLFT